MGFGLYQGDMLGSGADETYRRLLNEALLPRIRNRIEGQLRAAANSNPDLLYEGLRVYLMFHDRAHYDAGSVAAWLKFDLERGLSRETTAEQRAALAGHFEALLDKEYLDFAQPLNQDVVDEARRNLARVPLAQRAYSRLVREFGRARLPEFTVVSGGGPDAPAVLVRHSGEALTKGIPGTFTAAGYKQFIPRSKTAAADLAKDVWVLGQDEALTDPGAADKLAQQVVQLYFDDYIRRWDTFLADIGVVSFTDLAAGSRELGLLSGADSPLRKLLLAAARETTLASVAPTKSVADQVKGKVEDLTNRLENVLGGDTPSPAAGPGATPVDLHFDGLHHWVDSGGSPGSAPLDRSLAVLAEAKAFLDAAASAKGGGQPMPKSDILDKLAGEAKGGGPAVVAQVMKDVGSSTSASTLGGERQRLNALWMQSVAPLCQQAISNRYPIYPKGTEEVPQEDFGRVFAPGGLLDDFFQKNLAPYVDASGPRWRWRPVGNVSLGIPDEVLVDLQRAGTIRDAFFRGGQRPAIRFDLKPLSVDKGLTQFTFDIDGQVLTVTPTSLVRPVTIQWPGSGSSSTVRVEFAPAAGSSAGYTVQGAWALFRVLDRASLTRTPQRERFTLTFDSDGRKVVLELLASSVLNPFQLEALTQFRCPAHL
jgi:type VI secretion system protein ImpL